MIAKHIIFTGRVQGVGFRYSAQRTASSHQLTGWVRNLPDGSVEMLVQGTPEDVDNCINDIQQSFSGFVRETKISELPCNPRYTRFNITY
ncbi:MAG: acylphosphatase [Sedimentisphaerales bacterium]|nr:acylphosphatase [Sedimentisphaerales bacterium]